MIEVVEVYDWTIRKIKLPNNEKPTSYVCGMIDGFESAVSEVVKSYNPESGMVITKDEKIYVLNGKPRSPYVVNAEWQKWAYLNGMDPMCRYKKVRRAI
jgi:hypothetical protein|tara:strand:- start:299 stop:595 length:297 start_codon:yes stop_codon:yes gene_type:complete